MARSKKKTSRKSNQREYAEDEWVEWLLDGEAESMDVRAGEASITPELEKAVKRYESDIYDVVNAWAQEHPPKSGDPDGVWYTTLPVDLYYTLSEAGVGIWDGRWEHLYSEREIEEFTKYLKKSKLSKAVDFAGGGWFTDALRESVYATADVPEQENPNGDDTGGELFLYMTNTGELYPEWQRIAKQLYLDKKARDYTELKARRAFGPFVRKGAQRYSREIEKTKFSDADLKEAVDSYVDDFEMRYKVGDLDWLVDKAKNAPTASGRRKSQNTKNNPHEGDHGMARHLAQGRSR